MSSENNSAALRSDFPERRGSEITATAGGAPPNGGAVCTELAVASGGPAAPRPFSWPLLLRFKWTIVSVFVVLAPTGVLMARSLFAPEYTAAALLEIYSVVPRLVIETDETGPITQYERYVQTQADIMRSLPVLERVLERKDVQQTAWFREPPRLWERWTDNVPTRLERLAAAVLAAPRKRTELLEVAVTTRVPSDSAVLANALVEEYLKFARERFSEKDRELFDALMEEQKKVTAEIGFLEQVVTQTRRELLSPSPDELIAQRRIRLDQYEAELRRVELDLDVTRQQLAELEAAAASQPAQAASSTAAARYAADPEWRRLYGQWRELEQRYAEATAHFGANHPAMLRLQEAREGARRAVEERQRELDLALQSGAPGPVAAAGSLTGPPDPLSLRYQSRLLELKRQRLQQEVEELRRSFQNDFSVAERLRQKESELQHNKDRLQAVMKRLEELGEKTKVPASIRTISRATAPTAPNDTKGLKLSIAAVVGALTAGVACAYLRVRFSSRVQEVGDVGRTTPAAFLWELPFEPGNRSRPLEESPSHAESVRIIRTALLKQLARPRGNTVQITSAGPGSGKSTLAIRLARSLANCGKNVLLVEADLFRPVMAQCFELAPEPGLVDLLTRTAAGGNGARATDTPGLSVLPAGATETCTSTDVLANGAFSTLLNEWRRTYDFIVFDSPPLLMTADAAILAGHADGTVMVVRERHCRRSELLDAYARLSLAGGRLLGTAFIGRPLGRRYGHAYRDTYYRQQAGKPTAALTQAGAGPDSNAPENEHGNHRDSA